ncbi:hypothetical protein DDE18_14645 [Nocardioides gansuensis]|uniref:Peptidyl-prolyl cis-trans isomerase n=1 Tax=Nocardioides gansuensis TaxID=2138300 RepID=A0A2T8F8B9_9ACTN|nr:FKBP-type peptidyl-prolyl cis-trans isomerase [Nocardioides gansuensis]PVG81940.1 hypothetical protein DDE18_14645 [Nocardioides gansuensis]
MRRSLATLPLGALLLTGLVACGSSSDDPEAPSADPTAVEGVTVTGDFGKEPEVEVKDLDVTKPVHGEVIAGDGAEVTEESNVNYRFHIVYGSNGEQVADNYAEPRAVALDLAEQPEPIIDALVGTHVGSRVVLALPVTDLFGKEGAAQYGLDTKDDLVMVMDLVSEVEPPLDGPEGEAVEPPDDAPTVVEDDGAVTGIDFGNAPEKPSGELEVITLVEGSGEPVAEGDDVTVDYFGVVYGGKQPFDESYSAEPVTFGLTPGGLIDGWVEGLAGVKAGSRVMLVVPAEKGYGDRANGNIPANSTLVFVIDVLGVNL